MTQLKKAVACCGEWVNVENLRQTPQGLKHFPACPNRRLMGFLPPSKVKTRKIKRGRVVKFAPNKIGVNNRVYIRVNDLRAVW